MMHINLKVVVTCGSGGKEGMGLALCVSLTLCFFQERELKQRWESINQLPHLSGI